MPPKILQSAGELTHDRVWAAIDAVALRNKLSVSGLATLSGFDNTAFNKSKRFSPVGRPRWPSTKAIAQILRATGISLDEFVGLIQTQGKTKM